MSRLFRPTAAVLVICAGTFGPFSDIWAAEDPAAGGSGPVPYVPGLSPKYLPAYHHLTDGISWAGHADSELFSNLAGGIRRGREGNIAGQFGVEYNTEKAGLWRGANLAFPSWAFIAAGPSKIIAATSRRPVISGHPTQSVFTMPPSANTGQTGSTPVSVIWT